MAGTWKPEEIRDPSSASTAVRRLVIRHTGVQNWGTSGALKNAIDWASRDKSEGSFMGKPATIVGAGRRSGTARTRVKLQQTWPKPGPWYWPSQGS